MPSARLFRLLTGLLLVLSVAVAPQVGANNPGQGATDNGPPAGIENSVIAVFHPWVADPSEAANDIARQQRADVQFVYQHALKGFTAQAPAGSMARIERDPRVAYVEADQLVHTFGDIPTGVDRIEADKKLNLGDTSSISYAGEIDIAIIDTGIDHNHAALNVIGGTDCTSGNPFNVNCNDGFPGDGNGHGTHVAGTAAGKDGSGAVGVAPGADLWAVKVLSDNGSGRMSQIIAGIDWVTDRAETIDVANMSLGCECQSSALDQALTNSTAAGVVYVVAAGNSNADARDFSPASHPRAISTSAMADFDGMAGGAAAPTCRDDVGEDDTYALFSNYGEDVDILAPGVCIESSVPGGGYAFFSGTSMASPHAAGAAALFILENNVSKTSTTWSTVTNGLTGSGWSVAQSNECGLIELDHGKSDEPFLLLEDCEIATGDDDEAATGTITGTVTDSDTTDAIQGATIVVEGANLSTTTGGDGSYTIADVPVDTYSITASADRYEPETVDNVEVTDGTETTVDFALTPSTADDDENGEVTNEPVIDQFEVSSRTTGPWLRADVQWSVSHEDGALYEVTTELLSGTSVLDSQTTSVSGSSASGEHDLRTRSSADSVRLTVTDTEGNSVTESTDVSFN